MTLLGCQDHKRIISHGALPIMQMPLDTMENYGNYSIMMRYSRNATTSSSKLE